LGFSAKVGFEEPGDFGTLGVHHAINAKIEVSLIEHEKLGQQRFEFIKIRVGYGGHGEAGWDG
jgi:hypothetical protein